MKFYLCPQRLVMFRQRSVKDPEWVTDQNAIYARMAQVKLNLDEMIEISDDMNSIKDKKITSPRVVDQAKTYTLTVDT